MNSTEVQVFNDYKNLSNALVYVLEATSLSEVLKSGDGREAVAIRRGVVLTVGTTCEYLLKLSNEYRLEHPELPWREVSGTRNVIFHDYLNTDDNRVIKTAKNDFPLLGIVYK